MRDPQLFRFSSKTLPAFLPLTIYFLISTVVLALSFSKNFFRAASPEFFSQWQLDSDAIVVESVIGQSASYLFFDWGLLRNQQIGSQGHFFYALSSLLNTSDYSLMRDISAIFTAIIVSTVGTIILKTGNTSLSIIWFAVSISSPWLVAAAKNLYWIPWSWFLPLAISGLIFSSGKKSTILFLHAFLFVALFFRFAAGYEFASSIILMVMLFPLVLAKSENKSLRETGVMGLGLSSPFALGATSTLAFLATFLTHSLMRGSGDISKGASEIVVMDVLRRTHGDPSKFDEVFSESLEASTLEVAAIYFAKWFTPVLNLEIGQVLNLSLGGLGLLFLVGLIAMSIFVRTIQGRTPPGGYFLILAGAILIPVSWYVLAKGHSAIHWHINFLLWYPLPLALLSQLLLVDLKVIRQRSIVLQQPSHP